MHVSLRIALFFGGLAPLVASACSPPETPSHPPASVRRTSPATSPAAPPLGPRSWSVKIQTSGGFAGSGKGSVALHSDGTVVQPCKRRASAAELATVGEAVARSHPAEWLPVYRKESGLTDQFHYELSLESEHDDGSTTSHRAAWRDGSTGALPPDLRTLYEAAWRVRDRAQCPP